MSFSPSLSLQCIPLLVSAFNLVQVVELQIHISTLVYLINVQEVINMQAGNFSRVDKRAGCNKVVHVGIFQKSIVEKS